MSCTSVLDAFELLPIFNVEMASLAVREMTVQAICFSFTTLIAFASVKRPLQPWTAIMVTVVFNLMTKRRDR